MATGELVTFTDEERSAHEQDEAIVDRNLTSFVDVGEALHRIYERKTYLLTHSTWKDYVRDRWSMSHPNASEHMSAASIHRVLEARLPGKPKPRNLRVAAAMARTSNDPDKVVEVWAEALDRFGDAPMTREVRGLMDRLAPPRAYHREVDRTPPGDEEEREPEGDEAAFARWIKSAERALDEASDLVGSATATAHLGQATKWLAEVDALRVHFRTIRAAVATRAKADEDRIRRRRLGHS